MYWDLFGKSVGLFLYMFNVNKRYVIGLYLYIIRFVVNSDKYCVKFLIGWMEFYNLK